MKMTLYITTNPENKIDGACQLLIDSEKYILK